MKTPMIPAATFVLLWCIVTAHTAGIDTGGVPVEESFTSQAPEETILPYPVPARAGNLRIATGNFFARHEAHARSWIIRDNVGVVLPLPLARTQTAPEDPSQDFLSIHIKIYDAVGNLVQSASQKYTLSELREKLVSGPDGKQMIADIYWNGFNYDGMAVSPGIYRAIIYLDYTAELNNLDQRLTANIGIIK